MAHHDHAHEHEHSHGEEESFGMALGFRVFEHAGELYLAELEVTPYVDEPNALGATLVFHPLGGIDPTTANDELDWPAYPLDIDDDLTRDPDTPMAAQFQAILRQVSGYSVEQLAEFLQAAREEGEE